MNTVVPAARTALPRAAFPLLVLALSLAATPDGLAGPAPLPGLVAHWSFDEIMGRLTPDSSGQANDALVTAATMVKGVSNTALQFDGRASSVRCAHSPALGLTSALTIEAWIRLDSLGFSDYPAIVRKEGAYALRFADDGLAFILWFGGEPRYLAADKADWAVDQWYHLIATYDGAEMRLYLDGAEDEGSPQQQTGPFDAPMSDCWVGAVGSAYAFRGVIDEVRIFSRALTAEEVVRSHQEGRDSIRAQAGLVVEPRPVGEQPVEFRKPRREINMVTDGFIWIDAEDFTDYGGWLLDTQFVHLMGSAYLIAAGIGDPVDDATVAVNIPRAGKYRLWVRARNWLKEHSPGQFAVIVNGARSQQVFGAADAEDWTWEPAGEFDLAAGETRIALRDLTGYYGRCDALTLTTDLAYTPPNALEDVRQERSRLTGLSLEPKLAGEFDVIVVGAGSAGGVAALAAARMGAKTALIQNRPVLGGNASRELGVPISGAASGHPNARESGIIEELGRVKARFGYPKMSEPFRLAAQEEDNLTVLLNQHVFAVEMAGDSRIAAVRAVDTLTNAITVYRGKMFLDCTGDGWVGHYAGAEYRLGRESRDEFNESLAPEKADEITMSGCLMGERALSYRAEDTGKPVEYTPPPWAPRFPSAQEFGRQPRGFTSGQWWLEHPGDIDDIWDAERSRDELIRITFGYWDYIKNVWPERERAANYALTYVPILEAKRESRRLVGDYILTQNDVQNATVFPDRISYGGWPLDVHHPEGIFSGTEGPFDCNPSVPIYTIPFRCLYSANIDNLLFAGRDMSVTHIALGSVRVQGTLAALGQAAGTAAALCVQYDTTPRHLCSERIAELQQTLLKHDQYIPELRNEDPLDLARAARITASSEARFETFGQEHVSRGDIHPLNTSRAVMFPREAQSRLEAIHLLLASDADQPLPVTLHLRQATDTGDFSSTEDTAASQGTVPAGGESWVEFRLDCDLEAPYAWVWLEPTPGISWRLMSGAPLGSCRAWGTTEGWHVVKGQYYAFFTSPPIAIAADYSAANLVSGVTRIVGTTPNVWASDPEQPLPQWVELSFDAPVRVNTVYLTFDTDMNARMHSVPLVPQCVRDYELSYHDGAAWTTLAEVRGNFQRRRIHRFETVTASRLRLTVQATNGDRSARVFEIRAYEE